MATPTFESLAVHIHRIQSEFREMPGLRLSPDQAQRLWGLDATACIAALEYLVEAKFLIQTAAGEYIRSTDGPSVSSPLRMVKAESDRRVPGRGVA